MKATWWRKRAEADWVLWWLGDPMQETKPGQYWVPKGVTTVTELEEGGGTPYVKCEVVVEDWWWRKYGPEGPERRLVKLVVEK